MSGGGEITEFISWLDELENECDDDGTPWIDLLHHHENCGANTDAPPVLYVKKFLKTTDTSKGEELATDLSLFMKYIVSKMINFIIAAFKSEDSEDEDGDMQSSIGSRASLSENMISFIAHHVIIPILKSNAWESAKPVIVKKCVYDFLQELADAYDAECHHGMDDVCQTATHFRSRSFLGGCCLKMWETLGESKVRCIDPNVFIPLLRRLAMRDIVDPHWNSFGEWDEVLAHLKRTIFMSRRVSRSRIDNELNKITLMWRNARNSITCQGMYARDTGFPHLRGLGTLGERAPQRFEYFPKCSAFECANIETKKNPHKLRCKKCYYFHYCSFSCKEYSDEFSNIHSRHCDMITPENREKTKLQMEGFFGVKKTTSQGKKHDECNNCRMPAANCETKLMCCSRCKAVAYCSPACQKFDWQNGHKTECKAQGTRR